MNAEEVPTMEDNRLFEQSVDQFGQAYAATQAAIESLTTNNANLTNNVAASVSALQQQMNAIQSSLQNLAMAGVNRAPAAPPAAPQQAYQQPPQNKFQQPAQNQSHPQQYYPPLNSNSSSNINHQIIKAEEEADAAADEAEDVVDVEDVVDAVATNSNSREDRASISEHPQIPASNSRPRRTPTSDTRTKTIVSRTVLISLAVTTAEIATARCQTINTPPHEEMQWAARPRRRTKQLCQVAV